MFSQAQKHRYPVSDCFEENIYFCGGKHVSTEWGNKVSEVGKHMDGRK